MKLAILTRATQSYSTRRLVQAARRRGHEVRLLDARRLAISLAEGRPDLLFEGESLSDLEAVMPRIEADIPFVGTAVVRQFEEMGIACANSSLGIARCLDELRCHQLLSRHRIGMPRSEFVPRGRDLPAAIERLGGPPVVIKLLAATEGSGVILVEAVDVAAAIVETLQSRDQKVLIQSFAAESHGRKVQALVIGGRVVAAVRRSVAAEDTARRRSSAAPIALDGAYAEAAVKAVQILGLRVAGVGLLEGEAGPQVAEVDAAPELQELEVTSGIDLAGALVEDLTG